MFFILAACAGILWGLARRGRLDRLARVNLRGGPLILGALALQVIAFGPWASGAGGFWSALRAGAWGKVVHLASYALVAVGAGLNYRLPGFAVVMCGMTMNLAAILANGGRMPVSERALARAGMGDVLASLVASESGFNNVVLMTEKTRLPWLGDLLGVRVPPILAGAFSAGDLVLAAGIAWVVSGSMAGAMPKEGRAKAGGVGEGDRRPPPP